MSNYGVLGPCSFNDCKNRAIRRCDWNVSMKEENGGCNELFCSEHAYHPLGEEFPLSCEDCKEYYLSDMKLKCWFRIILALIVIAALSAATAIYIIEREVKLTERQFTYRAWNQDTEEEEEKARNLINPSFDHRAQSLAISLSFIEPLNKERRRTHKSSVRWSDLWFNVAFDAAELFSQGNDLSEQGEK